MPTPNDVRSVCLQALRHAIKPLSGACFFRRKLTAIDRQTMVDLLNAAAPFCKEGGLLGIRVSTRPDAIDAEVLSVLADHKVTAIELGVQSLDDAVLQSNNRGHTAQQAWKLLPCIKAHGFSLGLQMMIGLDNEQEDGALETARGLCEMAPVTVRIYPVLVFKGTPLEKRLREGKYCPLSLEKAVEKPRACYNCLKRKGCASPESGCTPTNPSNQSCGRPLAPAFRELCESAIMRERINRQLTAVCKGGIESLFVRRHLPHGGTQGRNQKTTGRARVYDAGGAVTSGGPPHTDITQYGGGTLRLKSLDIHGFKSFGQNPSRVR
jgi:hypothetical protein